MTDTKNFTPLKVGRPTDYEPRYCQEIIEYMAQGYSIEAFAGHIGVSKQTVYNWQTDHQEFLDAVKVAQSRCQEYWEKIGMNGMLGLQLKDKDGKPIVTKNFNAVMWIFNMKNRFRWTDRNDVTSDGEKIDGPTIYKPEKLTE